MEPPRLYLITPRLAPGDDFSAILCDALAAADVACVLGRATGPDAARLLKPLAALTQSREAAFLVEDDTRLAGHVAADGVHASEPGEPFQAALASMRPNARIVGCGGLKLRDDAMMAGEAGADYVMFGEPAEDDSVPPASVTLERASWWAEVFETPCVAYAQTLADIGALARANVEFVALGDAVWRDPRGAQAALRDAADALARTFA